jgi:hypothetical protein
MSSHLATISVILFLSHIGIVVYAWIEKRCKPILSKLKFFESEVERLHEIANEYGELGIIVPGQCIVSPQSVVVVETKRIQTRLMIEMIAVGCAGMIPSGLIALILQMLG